MPASSIYPPLTRPPQRTTTTLLAQVLQESMREHLELHFHNQEACDEKVLGVYPSAIRRRILRCASSKHLI